MVTNLTTRFERQLVLRQRPRSARANQFIRDNLERLRQELRVEKRYERVSAKHRRS
jgi:hypothetical protein